MASVSICDRCGAMLTQRAAGQIQLRTTIDYGNNQAEVLDKELCPDCIGAIVVVLEMTVDPVQRSYREPWRRPKSKEEGTNPELIGSIVTRVMKEITGSPESSSERRDNPGFNSKGKYADDDIAEA